MSFLDLTPDDLPATALARWLRETMPALYQAEYADRPAKAPPVADMADTVAATDAADAADAPALPAGRRIPRSGYVSRANARRLITPGTCENWYISHAGGLYQLQGYDAATDELIVRFSAAGARIL